LDNCIFKRLAEKSELFVLVKLCAMAETTSPSEDRRNWIRGSGTALLPNAVMSGNSSMSSLSFHNIVSVNANRCHQSK
jgi:hypothetical protein